MHAIGNYGWNRSSEEFRFSEVINVQQGQTFCFNESSQSNLFVDNTSIFSSFLGRRVFKIRIAVYDYCFILELTRYKTVKAKRLILFQMCQMKAVVTRLLVDTLD